MSEILFFVARADARDSLQELQSADRMLEEWVPRPLEVKPAGLSLLPFAVWWLFHYLHLFRNDQYKILLLRDGGRVVHRSCVFPRYFRFPFMSDADVQVGDIWTAESARGQGKAVRVLRHLIRAHAGRRVWFLCEAANAASANLARKGGMQLYARGSREPRFGIGLLGRFVIQRTGDERTT